MWWSAVCVLLFLSSCTTSEEEVDPGQCSNEKECTEKKDMYSRPVPMEPQQVLSTIAMLELYIAQREVAHYMELAYLGLADHPEQEREVRLTAHSARTQHLMTSGLMKKFTVAAAHIVETMIPMIQDAVVELQSAAVVKEIFGHIIRIAEEMKMETETTLQRYKEIQTEIQKNMANVKEVVDEKEIIMDAKNHKMEEELEILKSKRDNLMKKAELAGQRMSDGIKKTMLDYVLPPGPVLAGVIGGVIIARVVNFLSSLDKSQKQFDKLTDAYRESENVVERTMGQKRDVIDRIYEQRKEALQRLAFLVKTANLGNVESLSEAHAQLGNVDKQFTRIIQFWSNMAATLIALRDESTAGIVYLSQIENPKLAERFKAAINRAEKGWKFFGRICSDYVQESDTEIYTLYNFLSAPIDSMAASVREQRQREVLLAIEADIESTYPKQPK